MRPPRIPVAVAVLVLVAACDGAADTSVTVDTTATTTVPSTSAPGSSTSSSRPTTTTLLPTCDAGEPPDVPDLAWVLADPDGDGSEDRLVAYQVDDVARLRVELARGGSVDAEVLEPPGLMPIEPIGGHDLDGDGTDELFATVGSGAYTFLVGVWSLDGCDLRRLTLDGQPAVFPVGASVSNVAGLTCPESGGLEAVSAAYVDEHTYEGGVQRYEMAGSVLRALDFEPAVFEGDEAFSVAGLACGDFTMSAGR